MIVNILLFEGCDELDAIGPYEVFANARALGAQVDVALAGVHDLDQVTGANGAGLRAQIGWMDRRADLVLVPGGGWGDRAAHGTWAEVQHGTLTDWLVSAHAAGATVTGVCTGAMALAAAGLLDARPAVTHRSALPALADAGAQVIEHVRVVDDGDVMTSGGVTAAMDLALWVVEREFGVEIADGVAAEIEYERRGPVWTRDGVHDRATLT